MYARKTLASSLALIVALCIFSRWAIAEDLPKGILALDGRPAPALALKDMDGKAYDLNQSRGHWVFVHFWATWCGPCREEMPTIQQIHPLFSADQLEIVLVNTAESDDAVFEFIGIVAPDLSPLMDRDGLLTEVWQPRGLPATYFVDPKGRLRYLALGGRDWHAPAYLNFLKRITGEESP